MHASLAWMVLKDGWFQYFIAAFSFLTRRSLRITFQIVQFVLLCLAVYNIFDALVVAKLYLFFFACRNFDLRHFHF